MALTMKYDHLKIEKKWQKVWEKQRPWSAKNPPAGGPKYYSLVEFPYPSGDGIHMGHVRTNTAMDIISRKRRMEGYNVLYPIGWDAFGLPTENYAIKTGTSPEEVTKKNTDNFRRQLKALGFSFDWSREINTSDPEYYKWTQWIFLQFFKKGLAYKDTAYINWCSSCKIGLANEEVVGGVCERCGGKAEKRLKSQWLLRITAYADRLLEGLNKVDFLENIKIQQRNWIGRSEGRLINFGIQNSKLEIKIFTTRPDTIDGVTYMVLAPEHPLIEQLLEKKKIKNEKEIKRYLEQAKKKSDLERQEDREKTGIELKGIKVINPYNKEKIPVWVSDYVLIGYGTGAIMAVPAYDERDKEFAKKFKLFIKEAPLVPRKKWLGKEQVNYKLRDWVFSRQRYWGEPIPIIICSKCGFVSVPEKDLPVELPKIKNYQPRDDGKSPLASVSSWVNVKCPKCGEAAQRETDTMPNWAGSSWYYLAYVMQGVSSFQFPVSNYKKVFQYWLPVDWYNGGMEHVTLHLLYSRFWNLFLFDIGVVPCEEPYQKRTAHGFILGEGGIKMSKSKGNVVNPDDLNKEFGADAVRIYEMFIGPFSDSVVWDSKGIVGIHRFLNRVFTLAGKIKKPTKKINSVKNGELEKALNKTIKKVSEDIETMSFNTAVSALMILLSEFEKKITVSSNLYNQFLTFLKVIFPFAPHLSQELWEALGNKGLLDFEQWPIWDEKLIIDDKFDLVIQINGKLRGTVVSKIDIGRKEAEKIAAQHPTVKKWLENKEIKKIIFVPNKLINFII